MTLIQTIEQFFWSISLITINLWLIPITTVVYLFLHGQRHNKMFAQLSIIAGFIPVLIHEIGHAMLATITRGHVSNIYMVLTPKRQMREGMQGYAETASHNRLSRILITFAGYTFPPLMFITGVFLAVNGYSIIFVIILIIFFLYYLWHTSQKWLPLLILILLLYAAANMVVSFSEWGVNAVNIAYNIVLGLLLGEMIQSIVLTARINFKNEVEWDGTTMRQLTYLPATLWWFIWSAISIWSIYQGWNMVVLS